MSITAGIATLLPSCIRPCTRTDHCFDRCDAAHHASAHKEAIESVYETFEERAAQHQEGVKWQRSAEAAEDDVARLALDRSAARPLAHRGRDELACQVQCLHRQPGGHPQRQPAPRCARFAKCCAILMYVDLHARMQHQYKLVLGTRGQSCSKTCCSTRESDLDTETRRAAMPRA